jgi:hypothetical protein
LYACSQTIRGIISFGDIFITDGWYCDAVLAEIASYFDNSRVASNRLISCFTFAKEYNEGISIHIFKHAIFDPNGLLSLPFCLRGFAVM